MLMSSARLAEFAKAVIGRLHYDGAVEVEFGCLDWLVGNVRDGEIARGGIDIAAFLVGKGCRWHIAILLVLHAPHRFDAFEPALAGRPPIFARCWRFVAGVLLGMIGSM
jgi:hypothetical protein